MRRLGQTPDGETIGQRIRRVRLARKLSQDALSVPGVSGAYISSIEAGQGEPSWKALRKLAERLGVTAEYLETGLEVPQAAERALQLADAELELRVGHDLDRAERALTAIVGEGTRDATGGRALAALGLLAARRGSNAEAIRNLEAAIATGFVRPESRSDVFEGLAAAYVATNRTGAAIELLERCLAAVDEPALQLRYRTFLGTTLATAGSLNRARDELAVATEEAERYAAPGARVLVYWSQA